MTPPTDLAGHDIRGRFDGGLKVRRRGLALVDLFAVAAASGACRLAAGHQALVPLLVCLVGWVIASVMAGTLASGSIRMRRQAVATLFAASGIGGTISLILCAVLSSAAFPLVFWASYFVLAMLGRLLLFTKVDRSPVGLGLLVDDVTAKEVWPTIRPLLGPGYRVKAILQIDDPHLLDHLMSVVAVRGIDLLVTTPQAEPSAAYTAALHISGVRGTRVISFEELYEDLTGRCLHPEAGAIEVHPEGLWMTIGSRCVDVCAGLAYLPLWAIGSVVERFSSAVRFSRLSYLGVGGEPLLLTRFESGQTKTNGISKLLTRSMLTWAPSALMLIGGQLALVGPSPVPLEQRGEGDGWKLRQRVRPGVTGWAAINGFGRGFESLAYDLYYVRHRSFGFDLGIAARALAGPLLSWRAVNAVLSVSNQEADEIVRRDVTIPTTGTLVSVIVPAYRER